jgi:hypothetical protein
MTDWNFQKSYPVYKGKETWNVKSAHTSKRNAMSAAKKLRRSSDHKRVKVITDRHVKRGGPRYDVAFK